MQKTDDQTILSINAGSSSIKFSFFTSKGEIRRHVHGSIDGIGSAGTTLSYYGARDDRSQTINVDAADHAVAGRFLMEWLEQQAEFKSLVGIGHRVVHGMTHVHPEIVSAALLDELHKISPYDPDHLPTEIKLIEAVQKRHPNVPQVACFDTAFHQTMPRVAKLLPIPRKYDEAGVQRYGFHGLSYQFLTEELVRIGDPAIVSGNVILAHLGSGASMAAVKNGKSIDTSMGFTPTGGLVMSTRTGDLDPGVAAYLSRTEKMTNTQFYDMVSHNSGLLGVSGTSADMHSLLNIAVNDSRAAEATELFCYQAKKWVGAFAASLGGVDTIVFSAGIGENAPQVRSRICAGLEFLGVELDRARNEKSGDVISSTNSRVAVRVIKTDEELMIARSVVDLIGQRT